MVVIKIGGSVLDLNNMSFIKDYINNYLKQDEKIIIVVSAMGRDNNNYSTSTLSKIASKLTLKELDDFITVGEVISTYVVSSYLREQGFDVSPIPRNNVGVITDDTYGDANIIKFDSSYIKTKLKESNIIIVPGFVGKSVKGNNVTLGKGGSDLTAVYLSIKLNANKLVFIKDTNGIYDENPKINNQSNLIKLITYKKIKDLLNIDSKFMNQRAFKLASEHNLKIEFRGININEEYTEVKNEF